MWQRKWMLCWICWLNKKCSQFQEDETMNRKVKGKRRGEEGGHSICAIVRIADSPFKIRWDMRGCLLFSSSIHSYSTFFAFLPLLPGKMLSLSKCMDEWIVDSRARIRMRRRWGGGDDSRWWPMSSPEGNEGDEWDEARLGSEGTTTMMMGKNKQWKGNKVKGARGLGSVKWKENGTKWGGRMESWWPAGYLHTVSWQMDEWMGEWWRARTGLGRSRTRTQNDDEGGVRMLMVLMVWGCWWCTWMDGWVVVQSAILMVLWWYREHEERC